MKQLKRSRAAEPAEVIVNAEYVEELVAKGVVKLSKEQLSKMAAGGQISLPVDVMAPVMKSARSREAIEWIDPVDAVHMLAPYVGGDAKAKSVIGERLRDGAVECSCLWLAQEPDVGPLPTRRPGPHLPAGEATSIKWSTPINTDTNVPVLGGFMWSYSDDWERDFRRWQWASGTFVASAKQAVTAHDQSGALVGKGRSALRMVAKGVRFNRAHILRIIEGMTSAGGGVNGAESPTLRRETPSNRGRKPLPARANWIAELVIIAQADGVDLDLGGSKLHDQIADRLADRGLSCPDHGTMASTISAVLNRWREAKANGEI